MWLKSHERWDINILNEWMNESLISPFSLLLAVMENNPLWLEALRPFTTEYFGRHYLHNHRKTIDTVRSTYDVFQLLMLNRYGPEFCLDRDQFTSLCKHIQWGACLAVWSFLLLSLLLCVCWCIWTSEKNSLYQTEFWANRTLVWCSRDLNFLIHCMYHRQLCPFMNEYKKAPWIISYTE